MIKSATHLNADKQEQDRQNIKVEHVMFQVILSTLKLNGIIIGKMYT